MNVGSQTRKFATNRILKEETVPTLTVTIDKIQKAPGGIHHIVYTYTLQCTEEECAVNSSFKFDVNVTGADQWIDDSLAKDVDSFTVPCGENCQAVEGTRSFPIDTTKLNEDWGRDEIRLDIKGTHTVNNTESNHQSNEFSGYF